MLNSALDWFHPTVPARLKPWPWLHPNATAYFESILNKDMAVIEHGSGGSTLWLAERVAHVTSFENNLDWYNGVSKRAPANVTLVMSKDILPLKPVDLLFIDGEPIEKRIDWLLAAPALIKPGGWVVLDNANREYFSEPKRKLAETFTLRKTIDGNTHSRGVHTEFLVTEFWQL